MAKRRYPVGKVDFPWEYNQRAPHADTKFGGGATGTYDIISDEEALELWAPWIDSLFYPDAVCFFWCVWPKIEFCLHFIRACGFEPKTAAFQWVKTYTSGKYFQGPGYYTASNAEPVIVGARGRGLTPNQKLVDSIIETKMAEMDELGAVCMIEPHVRDPETGKIIHSRKPHQLRDRINLLYPEFIFGQKVGLFERESQGPGWDVFGDQVEGSIAGPDFQQLKLGV